MHLETDEWVTVSEAGRLLDVSHQRVQQMADEDGTLDIVRPWPRVTLIGRLSLAEWLAGKRPPRIRPSDGKAYVLEHAEQPTLAAVNINVARDLLREFIGEARPRWTNLRLDLWALNTASTLYHRPGRNPCLVDTPT